MFGKDYHQIESIDILLTTYGYKIDEFSWNSKKNRPSLSRSVKRGLLVFIDSAITINPHYHLHTTPGRHSSMFEVNLSYFREIIYSHAIYAMDCQVYTIGKAKRRLITDPFNVIIVVRSMRIFF